jgi:hypothetical protein
MPVSPGSLFRLLLSVTLLAWTAPMNAEPPKAPAPEPPLFEALVRSVTVERASLSHIDVRIAVALRASRDVTVRRLAFRDSSVEGVPVWIEALTGEWRLRRGHELLLPEALQARAPTLDLLQMERLADAVRRRSVRVRTTVGVDVSTPWSARLLFAGPTRAAIVQAEVEAPLGGSSDAWQPLVALSALVGQGLRSSLSPVTSGLRELLPGRRALADAVTPSLATVTVAYEVVTRQGERQSHERQTLGVALRDAVLCTTREAIEPWRFDVADAVLLQVQGARLSTAAPRIAVQWHGAAAAPAGVDAAGLLRRLPRVRGRSLRTPVGNRVRRITLLDRDSDANVVCLAMSSPGAAAGSGAWRRGGSMTGDEAAVFVSRPAQTPSLVWARVSAPAADGEDRLAAPLSPASLGSPVVSSKGLVGMLVSDRGLRPLGDLERAAATPVPVSVLR